MTESKSTESFEEQMSKLENLVIELERGDLSLDDAMKKFEEGIALTRFCQKSLVDAEQRVNRLMQDGSSVPFNDEDQ